MTLSPSRLVMHGLAVAGVLAVAAPAWSGNEPAAARLRDARTFLAEVRDRLHTDDFLLDQYTFTEKQTERRLDGDGNVTKVTSASYEVYPSAEPGHTYRKLAKEDGKQQEKEARAAARSPEVQAERRRKEAEAVDELFRLYDIRIVGREMLDGRGAILVTFSSGPGR